MPWWAWLLGAIAAIAVGATVWVTAFVLWPASFVMIVIGVIKLVYGRRPAAGSPPIQT